MSTKMVAVNRNYTKAQQRAYRARVWRREAKAEFSKLYALEAMRERLHRAVTSVEPVVRQMGEAARRAAPAFEQIALGPRPRPLEEVLGIPMQAEQLPEKWTNG